MTEYLETILTGQFEASLAMLNQCVRLCTPEHWEGLIAKATFRICRAKMPETMAWETAASLEGPSGFSWLPISRGELHIYNIRHIQHHTGQMSAYLRRVDPVLKATNALDWVRTGWP